MCVWLNGYSPSIEMMRSNLRCGEIRCSRGGHERVNGGAFNEMASARTVVKTSKAFTNVFIYTKVRRLPLHSCF